MCSHAASVVYATIISTRYIATVASTFGMPLRALPGILAALCELTVCVFI
jgi:hypothetical protein